MDPYPLLIKTRVCHKAPIKNGVLTHPRSFYNCIFVLKNHIHET